MSNQPPSSDEEKEEEKLVPSYLRKKEGIARKLIEGVPLSDDLKSKVKAVAQAQGKSEQEVINDLIIKGIASTDEELTYQLARRKVLSSITLEEAEIIMKKIGNIFGTWSSTPQPIRSQQSPNQPVEKDEFTRAMEHAEKDSLKGLPSVTHQSQGEMNTDSNSGFGQIILAGMGKYIIDKVLAPDHPIAKGIGKVIEDKGASFIEDWVKKLKEEGEL